MVFFHCEVNAFFVKAFTGIAFFKMAEIFVAELFKETYECYIDIHAVIKSIDDVFPLGTHRICFSDLGVDNAAESFYGFFSVVFENRISKMTDARVV